MAHTTTNQRVIRLGGHPTRRHYGRMWIFPTTALRDLAIRNRYRILPECNYVNTWLDVNGWGLTIGVAPEACHWPRRPEVRQPNLYKNPGYDLINI
jgi:hypothetical protein